MGEIFEIVVKVVVNVIGVWIDELCQFDNFEVKFCICLSQGVYVVLLKFFLFGYLVIMVLYIDDGCIFFVILWLGMVVVGMMDMLIEEVGEEFVLFVEEVDFIFEYVVWYLMKDLLCLDVFSVFVGICLFVVGVGDEDDMLKILCEYMIYVLLIGLFIVVGGKWMMY